MSKLTDFLYETTVGLVKNLQEKSVDMMKIGAATLYLKGVKMAREQLLFFCVVIFALLLFAVSLVVFPVAVVVCMDWSANWKLYSLAVLAATYLIVISLVLSRFFSEKRWMEMTKSNEILSNILNHKE